MAVADSGAVDRRIPLHSAWNRPGLLYFFGGGSGQGHPAPFLTLIFALLACGATVIIIIVSIVLTIVHLVKNLRQNNAS